MKSIFFILSSLAVISCEKNDGKQINVENRKPDTLANNSDRNLLPTTENTNYCYMSATIRDSVFLKYAIVNGNVTGKMKYKNFEKDSSFGDITGHISGDTLKIIYHFSSEGKLSEREIYFLNDSGVLLEGIGTYSDNNSPKQIYQSPRSINYSKGSRLNAADCQFVEKKLTN